MAAPPKPGGWQAIEAEVLARINTRLWPPGSPIPNEADLAAEFGVARATVNRALQSLAEAGWIERRRRAGSRVAEHPVRKAQLSIPVIANEVTAAGRTYSHRLLARRIGPAPDGIRLGAGDHLYLETLHYADARVHAFESRWINTLALPAALDTDFAQDNANAWLVTHAPFTFGDYEMAATQAGLLAPTFGCAPDTALVTVRRATWNGPVPITDVLLTFAPGHKIRAAL